jgi:hypothetical protein
VEEKLEIARPLLEAVATETDLDLILSLVVADDDETWLREQLADALRD